MSHLSMGLVLTMPTNFVVQALSEPISLKVYLGGKGSLQAYDHSKDAGNGR